jgi:hypothetical protein
MEQPLSNPVRWFPAGTTAWVFVASLAMAGCVVPRSAAPILPTSDNVKSREPANTTDPTSAARPSPSTEQASTSVSHAPLRIALRDTLGRLLMANVEQRDERIARLLRPFVVDARVMPGAPLPRRALPSAQVGRVEDVSGHDPGEVWYRLELSRRAGQFACVLLGNFVLDAVPVPLYEDDVTLVVRREDLSAALAEIHCDVVDGDTRAPIGGALIAAQPVAVRPAGAITDEHGHAQLSGRLVGDVLLIIDAEGYARRKLFVEIKKPGVLDLSRIELQRAITISGIIQPAQPGAQPIELYAYSISDPKRTSSTVEMFGEDGSTTATRDGEFVFAGLPRGEYLITMRLVDALPDASAIRSGKLTGWAYADARTGSVMGVTIVVPPTPNPSAK